MSNGNKKFVNYISENKTANDLLYDNNGNSLNLEKSSIEFLKKIWNEIKNKNIKLIENFDLSSCINGFNLSTEIISHVLLIDDCKLIAINPNYIVELSEYVIDVNYAYDNLNTTFNPKLGDIIKICLANERSTSISSNDENDIVNIDTINIKIKMNKKSKRKNRSMSESYCDVIKNVTEQMNDLKLNDTETTSNDSNDTAINNQVLKLRKSRSLSESNEISHQDCSKMKKYKGILKHTIYEHSIILETSEEDISQSFSDDYWNDKISQSDSDCCKKSVRFSDVIKKQLFRVNSSILGQRKKNHKKNVSRKRALERKLSEGESSENEENKLHSQFRKNTDKINNRNI